MPVASTSPVFQMMYGRFRSDVLNRPIVRAIDHIILETLANDALPRGFLRAYVHREIVREGSTLGLVSGCRAKLYLTKLYLPKIYL